MEPVEGGRASGSLSARRAQPCRQGAAIRMSNPPSVRSQPYSREEMSRLIAPRHVALVGVSGSAGSLGARTLGSLSDFAGQRWVVHPRHADIQGTPCFPTLDELPEAPDCVMLTVPRESVQALLLQCAQRGVGSVIVGSSGFSETGKPEHIALQERLVAIANEAGMRLVGPNCMGLVNYSIGFVCTFATVPPTRALRPASVAVVSQSGALGGAMTQAVDRGISVSHMLSSGNSSDVDIADFINYLVDDPHCTAIACAMEGMTNPERLFIAARRAARAGKPLVINKMATGQQGAQAAISHTGSLAGSHAAYRAALDEAGAILVEDQEAVMEMAAFFAKVPPPQAKGVAVLATSGGAAIMAADKAEARGVPLPQPEAHTRAILESIVPEFGAAGNPCDVTANVLTEPDSFFRCAEAMMKDANYGALVAPQVYAYEASAGRLKVFEKLATELRKPVCSAWVTDSLEGPGSRFVEESPSISMFRSMDRCFHALKAWPDWHERRQWAGERDARLSDANAARTVADRLAACAGTALTEREAKLVLRDYGIPVVGERLVGSPAEAAAAAADLGFPVAIKIESPDILHKTEAGVIALNVTSAEAAAEAGERLMVNAQKVVARERINGLLIQPMVRAGLEIMIGGKVDPVMGPLVVVGLGGVFVELLQDAAIELAPVSLRRARAMLEQLKGAAVLKGFRGSAPVDVERLAGLIVRASELVADQRERIGELDINPVICSGDRMVAVDALITLKS